MESRFDKNYYLTSLQNILNELDLKIKNSNIENYKYASWLIFTDKELVQEKHRLLSLLKEKIDEAITQFNNGQKHADDDYKEMNEVIKLLANLHDKIDTFLKLNLTVLNKPTSPAKEIAKNINYYGSKGLALGTILATTGVGIVFPAVGWYASDKFSSNVEKRMGWNDESAATVTLLKNFQKEIENTYSLLVKILNENKIKPSVIIKIEKHNKPNQELSTNIINTFFRPGFSREREPAITPSVEIEPIETIPIHTTPIEQTPSSNEVTDIRFGR